MLPDAYGCAVANRFGNLLDDDADPFDLISEVELAKEKKKKKKEEEEEKRGKQKKTGQKESQKDRRLPVAAVDQEPVPGEPTRPKQNWSLLVQPRGGALLFRCCRMLMVQGHTRHTLFTLSENL